ncbi:carboxymuconolactone decarboxylase family protein [Oryzibacter oryziterrae]|uniref:carboxymuconolactone decarboxylase family protein n=1 Tax=Oryzibacter oryziterrae TaxID=2766474 RepID=UPI001F399EB6|nr:carboxymuconolactone decarboxylase family protein [Oryzibacter oryziterrae]
MIKEWAETARYISGELKDVRAGAPDVMKAFSSMAASALATKALDTKTKELIALAIGVAIRCDDCIAFHAKAAVAQGATDEEVMETLGMAIYMGAGPSVMYASHAATAYREFKEAAQSAG